MIPIGISGKMQSGKSTLAEKLRDYIERETDSSVIVQPVIDGLKEFVARAMFKSKWWADNLKTAVMCSGTTGRECLQVLGVTLRQLNPDFTINLLQMELQSFDHLDYVLIPDIRYPNEADWVHSKGGVVIRLLRNPIDSEDETETALDGYKDFDLIIDNRDLEIVQTFAEAKAFLAERKVI